MTYVNIMVQICENDGEVVSEYKRKSHSFTRQFGQFLYSAFTCISQGVRDINEQINTPALKTVSYGSGGVNYSGLNCYAAEGQVDAGIVVGGGSIPFTLDDPTLDQLIDHGTENGQLFYSKVDWLPMVTTTPTEIVTTLHRSFMNMGPANVNVGEVGVIGKNSGKSYLLLRDVVTSQVIQIDQILNVDIEFKTII
jgi:hypothetical protein